MEPSDEELRRAVDTVIGGEDDDADLDAGAIASKIRDDRPLWKVRKDRVEAIVQAIIDARIPPRQVPEELFQVDFENATSASICERDWKKTPLKGVHHAQGGLGSFGAFLVKIEGDGYVVLKQRTQDTVFDVIATEFLRACGMRSPKVRVLPQDELDALIWALREVRVSVKGTCNEIHQPRFREAGAVLIEYFPGENFEDFFNLGHSGLDAKDWRDLGKMIVLDVVTNNPDRIACIWQSTTGNKGNILIDMSKPEGERFVAIDSSIHTIADDSLLENYVTRVKGLFDDRPQEVLMNYFGFKGREELVPIFLGMNAMISHVRKHGMNAIEKSLEAATTAFNIDSKQRDHISSFVKENIQALPGPISVDGAEESLFAYMMKLCGLG